MNITTTAKASTMHRGAILVTLVVAILIGTIGISRAVGSASQQDTASHPLVGTWVIDPEVEDPSNPPSYDAFMADGTLVNIGSDGASVGTWEPTGPRTANFTFSGLVLGADGGAYFVIRGTLEIDESGEHLTGAHSFTLVAPDGTVLMAAEGGGAEGARLHTESMDAAAQPLAGFPTWTPAGPEAATPAA